MDFRHEWQREQIIGVSGGILPVYVEGEPDAIAACSCLIGDYMAKRYHMTRFDRLAGAEGTETKHALFMAHARRLLVELKAWSKAKGETK